jgi:hypothetical protein
MNDFFLQGMHPVVLSYIISSFEYPFQHNYQNLIHNSLWIMSLLVLIVWQCAACVGV